MMQHPQGAEFPIGTAGSLLARREQVVIECSSILHALTDSAVHAVYAASSVGRW